MSNNKGVLNNRVQNLQFMNVIELIRCKKTVNVLE